TGDAVAVTWTSGDTAASAVDGAAVDGRGAHQMLQLDPLDDRLGDLRMLCMFWMLRGGGRCAQCLQRHPRVDHYGDSCVLRGHQDRRAGQLLQYLHDIPVASHVLI